MSIENTGVLVAGVGVFFLWIIAALASLGLPVVLIWAIIKLVLHFTK